MFLFFRMLIPLVAGIAAGYLLFFHHLYSYGVFFGYAILPLFTLLILCYFFKRYTLRWLFGAVLFVFLFSSGGYLITSKLAQIVYNFPKVEGAYSVCITDHPQEKNKTMLCRAHCMKLVDSLSSRSVDRDVLLYFHKDSLSLSLKRGNELLVYSRITQPKNNGIPDEFDYARYLTFKGISGLGFVDAGKYRLMYTEQTLTDNSFFEYLRRKAIDSRESLLSVFRRLGFKGDEFAVFSALTVGYKDKLSEDIRDVYSISGASHVLALSGLHIGFLYALIFWCMHTMMGDGKRARLVRLPVILILLWGFAFFTGLSPSVVRSVFMFSLLTLSDTFKQKSLSFNSLAMSAFFMLLVYPFWLFDVGFQLSFFAVASILLLFPRVYRIIPVQGKNRLVKYIWGLMSISVVAQIGTAPLVIGYFSRFSTYFLLTNLLVIPLVSLIMYGAVVMFIFIPFPFISQSIACVVRFLVKLLNTSVGGVEQLPYSSIDSVWLDQVEIIALYLLIILTFRFLSFRSGHRLLVLCSCLLLFCSYLFFQNFRDRPSMSLAFYHIGNCSAVHCIEPDGRSWLVHADSIVDDKYLRKVASNHWKRFHLSSPLSINSDYSDSDMIVKNNILYFGGKKICMVHDNSWEYKQSINPIAVDYIYIIKGYKGTLKSLSKLFHFRNVVLDGSLTEYRKNKLVEECSRSGIPCVSLSNRSSFVIPLFF